MLPKPAPPSCKVGGRNYKDGASMEVLHMSYDQKNASCHQCRCKEGQVDGCHHIFHCTLDDPSCARYEKRSHEQCCPACGKGGEIRATKTLNLSRNIVSLQVLVDVSRFSCCLINFISCGLKKCGLVDL